MAKKDENFDNVMESQIGAMGGEPQENGLGKLQHKAAYGAKEDLTKAENDEMSSFLQRSENRRNKTFTDVPEEKSEDTNIADGWVPIDRKEMGVRTQFYPESWMFYIKPAAVQAIKNWLSVDETNLLQVNKVFNEMIKLCVRITDGSTVISWNNVNSWDRFWFILKIRELTFASNKKTVTFEDDCENCDEEITFELRSEHLYYDFPDDDIIEKYWTGSCWKIDPQEFDIDHDELTLYNPTLAKEEAIIGWAQRERERGKKLDEVFPKFALCMMGKPVRDDVQFDRQMKKLYNEYKSWDITFFKFMDQVVTNITTDPKETLKQTCPHCGEEVVSKVKFPNGFKVLFDVETSGKKFGTR